MIQCLNAAVLKVELLCKVYDHAKNTYKNGFRLLTLGWSDGNTFLPVNSCLLSSSNPKTRINEAKNLDKRSIGFKRRSLRYMMLDIENRNTTDDRTLGEIFYLISDELSDIT